MKPQTVQALEDDRVLVRDEEHVVALSRPECLFESFSLLGGEELGDRTGEAVCPYLEVGETPRAAGRCNGGQLVYLPPRKIAQVSNGDTAHRSPRLHRPPEDLELRAACDLRDVTELQFEAEVRLVRPEPGKRLLVGEAREWIMEQLLLGEALDDLRVESLDEVEDLALGRVAHLDVELGVLGLPVAPLILVA